MKKLFLIIAAIVFATTLSAQDDMYYKNGQKWRKTVQTPTRSNYTRPVRPRTYYNYQEQQPTVIKVEVQPVQTQPVQQLQPQQQFNAATSSDAMLLENITKNMVQIQEQNNKLRTELNTIKKHQKSPGDYMVHAGRYQRAMLWTGILGGAATAGCLLWSTTKDCKESGNEKTFQTIGYCAAGVTAVGMLICYLSQAHCTVKAGKKLNVSLGQGLELSYNF